MNPVAIISFRLRRSVSTSVVPSNATKIENRVCGEEDWIAKKKKKRREAALHPSCLSIRCQMNSQYN